MSIVHNLATQRFEMTLDGQTAYLSYQILDNNTWNINHTIVPKALGGQGVGSKLAKTALDYAQTHNIKIIPSCSFVARYINKYQDYQSVLKYNQLNSAS